MPVGATVVSQAGKHQPQAVEQFRTCTKGTAQTGHAGALVQGQCGGHI